MRLIPNIRRLRIEAMVMAMESLQCYPFRCFMADGVIMGAITAIIIDIIRV